jgi:two-component sensor histidine kinase
MSSDATNCPTLSVLKSPADDGQAPIRDLRLEILKLRGQIKDFEQRSLQHAVMLREGDHRIKNSLQLVASLMRLQARQEASAPASDALRAAAARISSVAGIHDALQATEGTGLVNLGQTLRKLCISLQAMAGDKDHIEVVVDADEFAIPVALAQCVVLAVNELVSNALRHAFFERDKGTVSVSLRRTDTGMTICVADDGIGLPAQHSATQGYGTSLVRMMVRQLGGTLMMESKSGACFTILAPLDKA